MKNWNEIKNELMNGNVVFVVDYVDGGFEIGIVGDYLYLLYEGRNEKCKKENLEKYVDYLSNEDGFSDDDVNNFEIVNDEMKKEFEYWVKVNDECECRNCEKEECDDCRDWYEGFEEIEF